MTAHPVCPKQQMIEAPLYQRLHRAAATSMRIHRGDFLLYSCSIDFDNGYWRYNFDKRVYGVYYRYY